MQGTTPASCPVHTPARACVRTRPVSSAPSWSRPCSPLCEGLSSPWASPRVLSSLWAPSPPMGSVLTVGWRGPRHREAAPPGCPLLTWPRGDTDGLASLCFPGRREETQSIQKPARPWPSASRRTPAPVHSGALKTHALPGGQARRSQSCFCPERTPHSLSRIFTSAATEGRTGSHTRCVPKAHVVNW